MKGVVMTKKIVLVLIGLIGFSANVLGQGTRNANVETGTITGFVLEAASQNPMEYANIVLYNQQDSTQATGTITNARGRFQLTGVPQGTYFIQASFMGFESANKTDIRISNQILIIDTGTLLLAQRALQSASVVVEGDRPPMSYQIDRKVIDVGSYAAETAGTAAEVLENAPSVTVDIDGTVSLRGSSNFTVLIDGRPSILEAQNALQQIPAGTIDNIEIITNPSARYDPEGTAGIINIILKKNALDGVSGLVNTNGGSFGNFGGDATLNYKTDTYTALLAADYNQRAYPGSSTEESWTTQNGLTSYLNSDGTSNRGGYHGGLRFALGYNLGAADLLTFGGRYGVGSRLGDSRSFFQQWSSGDMTPSLYTSIGNQTGRDVFYALSMDYAHKFSKKGHELSGDVLYNSRTGTQESINELQDLSGNISDGQKALESGPEQEFRVALDYVLPLSGTNKFQAGYQTELEQSDENSGQYLYDVTAGDYAYQSAFSKSAFYAKNITALYTMYSGEVGRLGFQAGLRGEYTYRDIRIHLENQQFSLDRWDYFPSLHSSFQISDNQQAMASYSRRIHRPRGFELEPFLTWSDAYNVRMGNPGLEPEYIDSYELGYQTSLGSMLFSAETYYRVTHNKVERVQSVYADNVTLHSVENVGTDYALGTELMIRFGLFNFWDVNVTGNVYQYRVEGALYDQSFARKSFNWDSRINNSFKLWKNGQVQLNAFYHSPTVSAQGTRDGFFMTNLAVRQDFLQKKFSAILQVRDLLDTANRASITEGDGFYRYRYMDRASPMVSFTLRLNINNYKSKARTDQPNTESDYFDTENEM